MGTPGVGKTSISQQLASGLGAIHIDLGRLVTEEKLTSGLDKVRGSLVADNAKLAGRVRELIEGKLDEKDIIIEGHYATDVVDAGSINQVFVLRRHPDELRQLMTQRGWREQKIRENIAAEILDVCLYDAVKAVGIKKVCEIDATGKSADEVTHEITQVLAGKKTCASGNIDWLGKLEQQGRLDAYLKEL